MAAIVEFPRLTAAQREIREAQRERANWIRQQMAAGRSKAAIGRDLGIDRQLVDAWLRMPREDR